MKQMLFNDKVSAFQVEDSSLILSTTPYAEYFNSAVTKIGNSLCMSTEFRM